jgi:hypothetical protein
MKSFKSFISEAATDDRKEVAKALKKFAKKYVSGPISVTSGKGKTAYVMLRAKGGGEISNELRKMVIDKAMPKANPSNMDDIDYGNVTKRYIAINAANWKKVMGMKESLDEAPTADMRKTGTKMLKMMPKDLRSKVEKGQLKVIDSAPSWLGGKSEFQVLQYQPVSGKSIGGQRDPYIMVIVSNPKRKPMKIFAYYGTHPSPKALMFAKNNKLLESVEHLDESLVFDFPTSAKASAFADAVVRKRLGSSSDVYDKTKVEVSGPHQAGAGSPTMAYTTMAKLMKKMGGKLVSTNEGPRVKRVFKESVEHLGEARSDVFVIVDKKGKVAVSGLTRKNAHKEISRHRGGTIVLDPDAEVGDVLKKFATESVELDERTSGPRRKFVNFKNLNPNSPERKVYDILDRKGWRIPVDGFTLVQNMVKKNAGNAKKAADEIMKRYPNFKMESVEHLDEMQPHGMFKGQGDAVKKYGTTKDARRRGKSSAPSFQEVTRKGKRMGEWNGWVYFEYKGILWSAKSGKLTNNGEMDGPKVKHLNKAVKKAIGLK